SPTYLYTLSLHDALPIYLIGTNGIRLIGPLTEMDLPSRRTVRHRQSLTGNRKVLHVRRMKNEYKCGQPGGRNTIGKLGCRIMRRSEEHTSELQSRSDLVC